jgi:hypothetical protein
MMDEKGGVSMESNDKPSNEVPWRVILVMTGVSVVIKIVLMLRNGVGSGPVAFWPPITNRCGHGRGAIT